MITEENLRQIYQEVIKNGDLTTQKLNGFGLNSKDLKKLIDKGNLIRVKRGLYALKSANELYFYGKEFIYKKKKKKAIACFKKCLEIDPTHQEASYELFLFCIQRKKFEKSWQYIDNFRNPENFYYYHDNNFYLYLLLMMNKIPEKYREIANHLKLEDVKVMDGDYRYSMFFQNKIRELVLQQNFKMAFLLLRKRKNPKTLDHYIQILLSEVIKVQDENRNHVIELISQKNYHGIIKFYQERQEKYPLNIAEQHTLLLAEDIEKILNHEELKTTKKYTEDHFQAIREKNFKLAIKLIKHKKTNPIYLLLSDIIKILPPEIEKEEDIKFVEKKHEELLAHKGAILLKHMDPVKTQDIFQITLDYPDIKPFLIKEGKDAQIVLKFKNLQNNLNVNNLIQASRIAYEEQRYNDCIEISLQIIEISDNPKIGIYARIGLAYMKKRQNKLAINYLTIATELSKKEHENFDFTELISILKNKDNEKTKQIVSEEKKTYFKMTENEFNFSTVLDFYGINNFEAINQYIENSGLTVEKACEQLQFTQEQTDIIKLIYAREFYKQGSIKTGDTFFKAVEQRKEKSLKLKSILEEIRNNKKLYLSKQYETNLKLKTTLSPKS